ncbi:hypothetical protein C7M84_007495 [Penaeus vannamei]|uniref:Uncharacterized protein n=1 Tax=Penaeus vannamei TaxID=6689 RepID=A0A3R7N0J0_PENVA|nr:hypothetical protein C7M84_007495 [Penaeus vannamei]
MSRRLWNLLEWLVPDQGGDAAAAAPTAPAALHQDAVRPGTAGRRTHTPRRPTTPTLSASGGIYQAGGQGLAATQLRSSVSYTEGCVDRRYDTGDAAKSLLEKLRTKTPAKARPDPADAASPVTNNNENEPESKNVSAGGEKRKDEAQGSVGGASEEEGSPSRAACPGGGRCPARRRRPRARTRTRRPGSRCPGSSPCRRRGAALPSGGGDKEGGPPHAAQRADVISTSDEDDETRARGQIRRKPTKTRSDYSLHLDDSALGSSSTDTPEILSDPPRGGRDGAPGILTFSTGQLSAMTSSVRDAVTSMAREAGHQHRGAELPPRSRPEPRRRAVLAVDPGERGTWCSRPLHGESRPPTTPTAGPLAAITPTSSLRSNLKHKGQLRRKRSDSGHSVTFDLPEDCDNLGGAKARFKDDAEPLSKCMKEQCNSILDSDLSTTHILSPEDVLSWPRDDSQVFTWHQPLQQNITSLSDDGQTFCLNLPPLPPPRCSPLSPQFLPSLTWSSGESGCSGGSSARGPDSGYWGTGEGAVGTGRRGVKVVTQGRELYLPYAFLHHGRLRLRIVRGKCVRAS